MKSGRERESDKKKEMENVTKKEKGIIEGKRTTKREKKGEEAVERKRRER